MTHMYVCFHKSETRQCVMYTPYILITYMHKYGEEKIITWDVRFRIHQRR